VCLEGKENLCATPRYIGVSRAGGYAEQCVVPDPKYLVDVTGIEPTLAATYACSGLTAYSALRKVSIDKDRDLLLLMGLGGVGLSGLQIALGLGYRRVAVADIDERKRELPMASGASFLIDPRDADAPKLLTDAGGVSAAIDFVGNSATAEFATTCLRRGGACIIVGLFGGNITLPLPPLVQRAITLQGSFVGNLDELKELIELVKSGTIQPLPVETVSFDKVNEALERLRAGQVKGRLVLAR